MFNPIYAPLSTAYFAVAEGSVALESIIDSGECGENAVWKLNDKNELNISGTGNVIDYSNTFKCEDIPWYEYRKRIETVIISNGITELGTYAFKDCDRLASIEMPQSLKYVYGNAFENCSMLSSITFNNSVTIDSSDCFSGCENLKEITILGDNCNFKGTIATGINFVIRGYLESIYSSAQKIGQSFSYISPRVDSGIAGSNVKWRLYEDGMLYFYGSGEMSKYKDPTKLPWYSRRGNIYNSIIGNGITKIGEGTFTDCPNLQTVKILGNPVIGSGAFQNSSLSTIDIPLSAKEISRGAFDHSKISSIRIPDNVETIGYQAFGYCLLMRQENIDRIYLQNRQKMI